MLSSIAPLGIVFFAVFWFSCLFLNRAGLGKWLENRREKDRVPLRFPVQRSVPGGAVRQKTRCLRTCILETSLCAKRSKNTRLESKHRSMHTKSGEFQFYGSTALRFYGPKNERGKEPKNRRTKESTEPLIKASLKPTDSGRIGQRTKECVGCRPGCNDRLVAECLSGRREHDRC
jgi:hypothetical protein